jgi:malonate transporter and related proteins
MAAALMCHWFHLSGSQSIALMAFSALPTSSSAYVLATRMGYDGPPVAALVTLSTLLGMLSLPFALGVLRQAVVL